jgi:pre-mRNA-splicing helicase BRR2
VTQSASRIMRALFEICLKRGWGQAAQRTLDLAKMIDRSMWSCLNPLRQFRNIPEYVLGRLEKKEQFSWESFYQMNPQEIGDLTRFPKLGKILYKFVHHVPRVQIEAYAQPLTRSCLKVDLTATCDFKWEEEFHGKEEPFWLMVMDCNEETILYSYFFTLSKD